MKKYVNEWIVNITDITEEVIEMREKIENGSFLDTDLPIEEKYV